MVFEQSKRVFGRNPVIARTNEKSDDGCNCRAHWKQVDEEDIFLRYTNSDHVPYMNAQTNVSRASIRVAAEHITPWVKRIANMIPKVGPGPKTTRPAARDE